MTNGRHTPYGGPMSKPRLLAAAEVAARLQVSPRTVARYAEQGRLKPAMRLPGLRGALLFDPADVERLARMRAA